MHFKADTPTTPGAGNSCATLQHFMQRLHHQHDRSQLVCATTHCRTRLSTIKPHDGHTRGHLHWQL
jgi:hypothetical protein